VPGRLHQEVELLLEARVTGPEVQSDRGRLDDAV
jgi:hypothetical protein